jgi:hypothetical protein
MQPKTYRVELTEAERVQLLLLIRQGKTPARTLSSVPTSSCEPLRVHSTTRVPMHCM